MKVFFKKFKKLKFIYKFIYLIVAILFLLSTVYFIKSLLLYILISLLLLFTKRNKTFIFTSIFVFIILICMGGLGYFIHKTYSSIDDMNEEIGGFVSGIGTGRNINWSWEKTKRI